MIVVDTSVWIDYLHRHANDATRKLMEVRNTRTILVGDVVLLEVLQGARDEGHARRLERNLRQFQVVPMLDDQLAVTAARNYRHLRQLGITVRKSVDLVIATFCIERGHALLHRDRDFAPMIAELGLEAV